MNKNQNDKLIDVDAITFVIDVDDVISTHVNRDYDNAIPNEEVIGKINELYDSGVTVKLFTARGQVSCKGDIDLINKTKRPTLEKWLAKHNVKYHELLFGKPIADMYVDDKCMTVQEFLKHDVRPLKGGSNKQISKIGNLVKKEVDPSYVEKIKWWFNEMRRLGCNVPEVISSLYSHVYYTYIEGDVLYNDFTKNDAVKMIDTTLRLGSIDNDELQCDINQPIEVLRQNYDSLSKRHIDACIDLLIANEERFAKYKSMCHGDFTISNIIKTPDNELYMIDPVFNERFSTYLIDFAKLRMSLSGYERRFNFHDIDQTSELKEIKDHLDAILETLEAKDLVLILEFMYAIRLYRYKTKFEDKINVLNFASDIYAEMIELGVI